MRRPTGRAGEFWTLQQFSTTATGKPYFALQRQTDEGVNYGTTGTRDEITNLCAALRITPEELPPIPEDDFYRRMSDHLPAP